MLDARELLPAILALHDRIRTSVVDAFTAQESRVAERRCAATTSVGDTIYAVDRVSEETLVAGLEEVARDEPLVLVAEGLPEEGLVLPRGATERDCRWRLLVDPIDGTRGLMYQKRPAWILTGVAPNRGADDSAARHRARGADGDPARQAAPVRSALGGARRGRARDALRSGDGRDGAARRCGRRAPTRSRTASRR